MKKNITLFLAFLTITFAFGQNKFSKYLTTKKLGFIYKSIKDNDKDEYYQQYYWLSKAEELKNYEHLSKIKPIVFLQFVKEINPAMKSKEFTKEDLQQREIAVHSLNQYFANKEFSNQVMLDNLYAYVDPQDKLYNLHINPETVAELVPKDIYTFTTFNKKTKFEKIYYLWVNDDKYKIIDATPPTNDTKFYNSLTKYVPNYAFTIYPAKIEKGKRGDKDEDFYFVKPFSKNEQSIEYKTKDFKTFVLDRYRTSNSGVWYEVDKKR